ncbi:MAG TPA: hypothetical protein VNH11_00790 [Pirellulales bacterium]|nr:hypothetical protein [Pirellulales bacterium]
MSTRLDMGRIAKELGAERRGKMSPRAGFFGAVEAGASPTM